MVDCCRSNRNSDGPSRVLSYLDKFVFCAVSGASVFVVASMATVQMAIFLNFCRRNLEAESLSLHYSHLKNTLNCLKASLPPFLEMLATPFIFAILHAYVALPAIVCVLACWILMACTCYILRRSKIVTGCVTMNVPVYSKREPFATVTDGVNTLESQRASCSALIEEDEEVVRLSYQKALFLSFAFVPFRLVTATFLLVLIAVKLCYFPMCFVCDVLSACLKNMYSTEKNTGESCFWGQKQSTNDIVFKHSSNTYLYFRALVKALFYDLTWIASLGLVGVPHLMNAATTEERIASSLTSHCTSKVAPDIGEGFRCSSK